MNKISTLLFILICFTTYGQKVKNKLIEFNGLYETTCEYEEEDEEGTQNYLRFYPNGKVISVSTDCDGIASDLKDWFNLDMKYLSVGNYELNGKRIRFSTKNRNGTVNYRGQITISGSLKLRSKSLINGYISREEYQFKKVVGLK
ncbi:MAG: hypothetical protein MUO53_14490 [Maribacter sp.]|nr:hypothetical protein [Maribacter sp.]